MPLSEACLVAVPLCHYIGIGLLGIHSDGCLFLFWFSGESAAVSLSDNQVVSCLIDKLINYILYRRLLWQHWPSGSDPHLKWVPEIVIKIW